MITSFTNKMPSEVKEFFTPAKTISPKVACVEYSYKLLNVCKGVADMSNSQYNKTYLADDYEKCLKQQNIVFPCIGKLNSDKRRNFEKKKKMMLNENEKTIDAYNNLLKILNAKNKQFEQNVYNEFSEDQNLRAKECESFDITRCREVIERSSNPKIKQKINSVIDSIEKPTTDPVKDDTPQLKIKSFRSSVKDMYPKSATFTMKITASSGMGKNNISYFIFAIAY